MISILIADDHAVVRRGIRQIISETADMEVTAEAKNGQEVLAEVKQDPDLKRIPIIIMSSSSAEKDILASYNLHANCYVTKPLDLDEFIAAVRRIEDFWIAFVKLPQLFSRPR